MRKPKIICISLDITIGEDITIKDTIADNEPDILEKLIYKELITSIKKIIKNILSEEEKYLICSLYGIDMSKKNQKVLADEFECNQGNISKKHHKIVNKIKKCYN